MKGYEYDENIIREIRNVDAPAFLTELYGFIDKHVSLTLIDEDLNVLLLPQEFRRVRKTLKQETLMLLRRAAAI